MNGVIHHPWIRKSDLYINKSCVELNKPMIGNHHFDIIDSFQHFGGESKTNLFNKNVSTTNNFIKDEFGLINWTHSDNQRNPIKLAHHVLWLCIKGNCQILIGQHQFTFSTS